MKRFIQIALLCFISYAGYSQEICNNGIDDDSDGLVDLNDTTDCDCQIGVLPPIIPNPSFESFSSCPTMVSQMNRVNFWQDAVTLNTPDYYNCGFSVPATSTPFPHGTGAVGFAVGNGNGKEFIGTCLLDTLHAGVTYNLQFQYAQIASITPRPIAIYGTANCANIPYPRTPVGSFGSVANCPSLGPNWVTLDSLTPILNNAGWNTYTFTFTPSFDVTAIVIGPSCQLLSAGGGQAYYGTIDDLRLSYVSPTVYIDESGHYCRNNLVLTANYDSVPISFQWYRNGIALVNDTVNSYLVPSGGIGNYQVILNYNDGCLLSDTFVVDTPIIEFQYDSSGSCSNTNTGTISTFGFTGGTSPYDFSIQSSVFGVDSNFSSLFPGIYSVSVRDSNLCVGKKLITVEEFPEPTANFKADTVCLGQSTQLTDRSQIQSGTLINWNWETPINSSLQNITYTFTSIGINPVTLTVTSDSGCVNDTTLNVVVNPLPIIDFTFSPSSIFT
ncbi:MAG: PKD domain-containing protein, partial [Flavobacteriales bacterium]